MSDLTAEDKYYYWLMISIGLDNELVEYIRDCVESKEEVSDLILELYNESQNRNALKRILYLSDIKSAAINKMSVKARIDNYFYMQLLNKTFTPGQIGEYLEKIYELEPDWSDFDWISENYSLARTGVFSLEDADNRLRKYLKDNASCNLE
jgi:hypothetical protein